MLFATLLAAALSAPQAESRPAVPPTPIQTDPNGWPAAPEGTEASPAKPAAAPVATSAPAAPPAAGMPSAHLDSPLRDVWQAIGRPADLAAQGGALAEIRLHLYDPNGSLVETRTVRHEADLRRPERDRLTFGAGEKVLGRDGAAAWALVDGVLMHTREREAREVLNVMGLLMRAPWVLAGPRYVVFAPESIDVLGRRAMRVRIESQRADLGELVGPASGEAAVDRFELICRPDDMRPEELRYSMAGSEEMRRVLLQEYQRLGGLRVPVRRLFVAPDGRRMLEVEIVRMQFQVDLPAARFRPPVAAVPGR